VGDRAPVVTLDDYVGAVPEPRTLQERSVTLEVDDPITDDVVTREFTNPERQIRIASLAVNAKVDGEVITRWHRLVDFEEHLAGFEKGNRLKVHGFFRNRTFTQDGEEKTVRELVVTSAQIQPKRVPAPAPDEAHPAVPEAPEAPPVEDDDIPF